MKQFAKLSLATLLIFTIAISCDLITESEDNGDETEQLEFSIEPSDDLSFIVDEAPEDFTWEFFNDNMLVNAVPGSMWSGNIVLTSFQIRNGEVVNENESSVVETNAEALSEGISTEELFSGSEWVPGAMWVPGSEWVPGDEWIPGMKWSPSEIQEIALNEVDLSENQTMVVVYAETDNSSDREDVTQPYGLIFTEEAATGSFEVATTTTGSNQDEGYEVSIGGQTEPIGANETTTISGIATGEQDAELTDIADNCSVINGENPRTVTINENQTTSTTFEVNCAEALNNQVAFTSFREGNANLYVIGADGTGIQQLTSDAEFDGQAAISPNGTKIAFTSIRSGNREIYVMNSDGSGLNRLTNNSVRDEFPAWSPDGSQLAFSSQRDGVDDIYTMNADGSNITRITTDPEVDSHPSWSPDGSALAFETLRDGAWNVYKVDADGSNVTQLTSGGDAQNDRDPEWSPDGSQIVYSTNQTGNTEIFVMDSDGSNQAQVTDNDGSDILPSWSPDGSQIAFQSDRAGGNIHIIGSDGSSPSRLTMSGGFDETPNWSPVE